MPVRFPGHSSPTVEERAASTQAGSRPSSASSRPWLVRACLVAFILLGAALRLYQLDAKSLWYDELGTALYTAAHNSPLDVVRQPLEVPVIPAPPLYFLSTYVLRQVSETEFVLRLPSVFYGVLAIAATYVLGKALIGQREGLIGAFLLTISTFHIRYSQEARYYALLMLLAILSLYFLHRGLRRNGLPSWVGYVVSSTLALYTHLFALLFLLAEGIYAVIYFAERSYRRRIASVVQGQRPERSGQSIFSFLISVLAIAVLYLPILPYTLSGVLSRKGLGGTIPSSIDKRSLTYLAGVVDLLGGGPGLALVCYVAALGLGLYVLGRRSRHELLIVALWIALPFLVVFLVPAGHNFRLRYVIFVLPLFLLLCSTGFVALGEGISGLTASRLPSGKASPVMGPATIGISFVILSLFSLQALRNYWSEEKQPWDKAAAFLQTAVGPSEVLMTTSEDHAERLLYYDYDVSEVQYLAPCPCPVKLTLEHWHRFPILASTYQRVWLLDPNPSYRFLAPGGWLAEELQSHIFLPPIIFKGYTRNSPVEADLLAPFMTSDVSMLVALPRDSHPSAEQLIQLVSDLALQAQGLFPGGTRLEYTLGELYRIYGAEDTAVAHYEAAIAADPRFYPAYEGLALVHVSRGEMRKALDLYSTLSELGVIHESYYHFLLGSVHIYEGDLDAGIGELALAAEMDPDDVYYRLRLGDAYQDAGRPDDAIRQYDEIVRLAPTDPLAYLRRGEVYEAEKRLTEAIGQYEMAVQLDPDNAYYHALLANAYAYQGLLDRAVAEAQEAVRLEDGQASYHVLLGKIYQAQGRIQEATTEFEEAVHLDPTVAAYLLNLAEAYRLTGRTDDAVAAYEQVLKLDPDSTVAAERLRDLR